jgi:hypothetical protein
VRLEQLTAAAAAAAANGGADSGSGGVLEGDGMQEEL